MDDQNLSFRFLSSHLIVNVYLKTEEGLIQQRMHVGTINNETKDGDDHLINEKYRLRIPNTTLQYERE